MEYLCTQCGQCPGVWANGLCNACNEKDTQEILQEIEENKRKMAYLEWMHALSKICEQVLARSRAEQKEASGPDSSIPAASGTESPSSGEKKRRRLI